MTRAVMWWKADEGKVYEALIDYVRTVERQQRDYFDSFVMYEAHYDPNGPAAGLAGPDYQQRLRGIKENVVAVSVDTVRASLAATEIRARFLTDGADWSTQRRAQELELYAEELCKLLDVGGAVRAAFDSLTKNGTGTVKVYADQDRQVRVEPALIDNIVADDRECVNGAPPRQIHNVMRDYSRDELIQQFPEHADAIEKAGDGGGEQLGAIRRRIVHGADTRNDVLVVESWRLPMGVKPDGWEDMDAAEKRASRYIPGRHVICTTNADLFDEEWHKPHFGMAIGRWSERKGSFYGIGLVERIIGHQRVLDRRNHQRDRQLDYAVPTTYVSHIDQNIRVQRTEAGNVIALKGDKPTTVVPTVIGPEIANDRHDAKASAIQEIGLPEIATRGTKPAGLESGASLREFKDQTSQRFSLQEKAFERLWLDVVLLILDVCRDLGDDAPELSRQTRFGPRRIKWADVDMSDVKVQIAAASTLARTPAGRTQTVLELTQAGALNLDELRKLLDHPDLRKTNSLYTASMEAIEHDLELIEDGTYVIPEPFINLEMAERYAVNRYLVDREAGAPEAVLEGLRAYAITAAEMMSRGSTPPAGAAPALPGAPMDPALGGAIPPGTALPGMEGAMPLPPMPSPQQVPSAAPPTLPAGTGPMAA